MAGYLPSHSSYSPAVKYTAVGLCTTAAIGCGLVWWYRRAGPGSSPSWSVQVAKRSTARAVRSAAGMAVLSETQARLDASVACKVSYAVVASGCYRGHLQMFAKRFPPNLDCRCPEGADNSGSFPVSKGESGILNSSQLRM